MATSLKFRGKEITNPVGRKLVGLFFIVLAPVLFMIWLVLMILSIPVHFLLKATGRQGFMVTNGRNYSYHVDRNGFKKALPF